jgi:hypothetical protein
LIYSQLSAQTDSIGLSCPLANAVEAPIEKKSYDLGISQPKLILTSTSDTIAKACSAGIVTNVMKDEDGRWELMFQDNNHLFWYSGLKKVAVVKGQKIQKGEAVGLLKPGAKLELMLYDFETPLDPKLYLPCTAVSRQ